MVEDGRPFCPQCRSPQIHVALPESGVAATQQSPPQQNSPQEFAPEILQTPQSAGPVASTGTLDRGIATRAAIKAGVLGFFLGMLLPFIAIVLAGGLAVFFYRRESGFVLSAALASRIGGAAGVVAVAIQSLFFTVYIFIFHRQQDYIDSVTRFVHSVGGDASASDIQASIRSLFTPAGLIVTLFFVMIFAVLLSSVGGALASLFLHPRKPRT
jgi:hypothetical protein